MSELPAGLQTIVRNFASAPKELRLQALLDYSRRVPPAPQELIDAGALEDVPECQTPFALATEIEAEGSVRIHFDCSPEAPTIRGYAGILLEGLKGATADQIEAVPVDFYLDMGLEELVTPLRMGGMGAILARLKRNVRESAESAGAVSGGP